MSGNHGHAWFVVWGAFLAGCTVVEEGPPMYGEPADQTSGGEAPVEPAVEQPAPPAQGLAVQPVAPAASPVQAPGQGNGALDISCQFNDGWVSVMPRSLYRSTDEFLMQALIGFSTDRAFWSGQSEWTRLAPYAATQCGSGARRFEVVPGDYVVLVGWAGRFAAQGEYSRNGRIDGVTVGAGQAMPLSYTTDSLNHDWVCISCPWLVVRRSGRTVDAGQVLVDRYAAGREGTDSIRTEVDVRDGRIVVTLSEREPEVSRIDAVEVRVRGRALSLAPGAPVALGAADGARHELSMGESIDLAFAAPGTGDGTVAAEIRVTGYYDPIGPLMR